MSIKQNIVVGKGETLELSATYRTYDGEPVDLMGSSVTFTTYRNNVEAYCKRATVDSSGNIEVIVPATETEKWEGKYTYVLEYRSGTLERWLATGTLTVVTP